MKTLSQSGLVALAAAAPFVFPSAGLQAQDEPEAMAACTASVLPTAVAVGQAASRLSVELSEPIGEVTEIRPDEGSGLRVADPEDLPRIPMAAEGQELEAIQMAREGAHVTVWLNTEDAAPGSYELTLMGSQGECTGILTVERDA